MQKISLPISPPVGVQPRAQSVPDVFPCGHSWLLQAPDPTLTVAELTADLVTGVTRRQRSGRDATTAPRLAVTLADAAQFGIGQAEQNDGKRGRPRDRRHNKVGADHEGVVTGMENDDPVGAFVPGPRAALPPSGDGSLSGLTLAVKDLFDVAGVTTTFGNPDWARTHPPAAATAPVILSLLEAGARLVGKTRTVELAYGLTGENVWHGTPLNPRAPDRFPGGSSCGSAAAVAGGLVDVALGSDTGGSVRIPASYCGLFGIRPSHGAISLAGACPLAPSLDTPGWFTRSAHLLARVGQVLLPPDGPAEGVEGPLLRVQEAWINAEPAVANALAPAMEKLQALCGAILSLHLAPEGVAAIYQHFRAVQAQEVWVSLGGWVTAAAPQFGPGVAERFAAARVLPAEVAADGRAFRATWQARVRPLLAGGAVLVYPTSPCQAPLLTSSRSEQEAVREATIGVTALAGLAGLPEVTLPIACVQGGPVGLSLVAAAGRDRALLRFATRVAELLRLD